MNVENFEEIYQSILYDNAEKFIAIVADMPELLSSPGVIISNSCDIHYGIDKVSLLFLLAEYSAINCLEKFSAVATRGSGWRTNRVGSLTARDSDLEIRVDALKVMLTKRRDWQVSEDFCVRWLSIGKSLGWDLGPIDKGGASSWAKEICHIAHTAKSSDILLILVKANYVSAEGAMTLLEVSREEDGTGWHYYTTDDAISEIENIRLKEINICATRSFISKPSVSILAL